MYFVTLQEEADPNLETIMPPQEDSVESGRHATPSSKVIAWWHMVRANKAMKIDVLSRVIFPAVFLVFATCYWIHFL